MWKVRRVLGFVMFCLLAIPGLAQEIEYQKTPNGYQYTRGGEVIGYGEVQMLLRENKEAYALTRQARSAKGWSTFFGIIGGGLIGWPIGTLIGGGDPNWALAAAGAGLVIISIPIASGANKKMEKAIDVFNQSQSSSQLLKRNFNLSFTASSGGVGFCLTF